METAWRSRARILVLVLGLAACAHAQERPRRAGPGPGPDGVRVLRDLEYTRAGDRPLLLDLYLPERPESPRPVIVWVHGGAWRGGSRRGGPAPRLASRGYAVASIDYRLSREAPFPAQIQDCKAAVRWLRAHARDYRLDPDRIGAWGSSAGGHLVALLGTSGGVPGLEGQGGHPEPSSRVQAVCDFFGPTDFLKMGGEHDAPDSPESLLIGGPIQQHPEEVARANPITYVTADDPPFLILHGDRDQTVPLDQSQRLHDALKRAGVESTFHVVEGAGHGFGGPELDARVDAFFDRHLKGTDPGSRN